MVHPGNPMFTALMLVYRAPDELLAELPGLCLPALTEQQEELAGMKKNLSSTPQKFFGELTDPQIHQL